jgi:hypothetical protein
MKDNLVVIKDKLVVMAAFQCHAFDMCEQYEFFNLPKTKARKRLYELLLKLGQEK